MIDHAISNTTLSELVASVAGTVVKTALRSCARRLHAPSPEAVDSLVAQDLLGFDEDETADPQGTEEPPRRCPDTSDPSWRQHVHLRKNDKGKSSLEECMSEWDRYT